MIVSCSNAPASLNESDAQSGGDFASHVSAPVLTTGVEENGSSNTKHGGILVLANRGDPPAGFDTLRTSSIALHHVGGAIFGAGNLVTRCRENMYVVCPYVAESWVVNDAFDEWIFTIRDMVSWHDGTPMTAEDIKFWLELVVYGAETQNGIRAPAYFKNEFGKILSVDLMDHNRLRVTLMERNPHFLSILANPRFKIAHPKHLIEPILLGSGIDISPLNIDLVGLGPFKFKKYDSGGVIRVVRFQHYWETGSDGRLPYLDGIDYVIMPDPFAMDVAFRTGRLGGGARGQKHYLTAERRIGYDKDLGGKVWFAEMDGGNFRLAFNVLKAGPWQDANVRRAMSLWINRPASIDAALGGFGWTTPDLGHPNIIMPIGRSSYINWPKFDIAPLGEKRSEAERLLIAAGYSEGFTMGHLCRSINRKPCEFLRDQLDGLGVELEIQLVDEGEWNRGRASLDYDSQQGRLTPSPIPEGTESVYGRYSENPDAYSKHEDYNIDELYKNLRSSITVDSRIERWRMLERYIFVEESLVIPIAESINVIPYRSYVHGVIVSPEDGHTHTDFATVYLSPS